MKNISVALFLSGAFLLFSCQENANQEDGGNNTVSQDSTTTGLEGTRDQSGTIGGTEVKVDTSAGQREQTGDSALPAGKPANPRKDSNPK
jgi:hypothetical protein